MGEIKGFWNLVSGRKAFKMVSMVLFEHASGYALFRVKEFEETSALEAEVEASVLDVSPFNSVVNLVAFSPFTSALDALTNINSVSEGAVTPELKTFIESNLPKKLKKFVLGVTDSKLGSCRKLSVASDFTLPNLLKV